MSKWRTLRSDKVDMEFSDYYKMRNSAEPIGPSSSTFVVGSKTKINKNGMDESSPSYNRIVRPIMVMPQEPNSDQIKQWKTQMTKNGDLYQNAGGWLWDNLSAGAGYTMASYEDYVSWSKDNGSKNDPELLKSIKNAKKGVVLTDKNFSPPCVFWENITTRTTSPYSAMFRAKQMMFERTVYKGGKGVFSIVCPDTQSLNFWVTVCIYDGGFPTKIPTSADQASNSFTLSPSNPRQVVELPRAVKKNITSLYCAGEKNLIEDTKSGFDSNYDYLTVICIVTFAEPNEKYIGKNIGQLVFEFEAEGDGATENKAVTNYSLWQINGFNSSASGSISPTPTPAIKWEPATVSLSNPLATKPFAKPSDLVTTNTKDTVLWSSKFQMGYTIPHAIPILKNFNRRIVLEHLRRRNSPMLRALQAEGEDVFYGVKSENYLAALSATQLKKMLTEYYGPFDAGCLDTKQSNGTYFSASGFNIENSFKIPDPQILHFHKFNSSTPLTMLDEDTIHFEIISPTSYTPRMYPPTFHFTPSNTAEGYTAPEFEFNDSTSYTISVPFLETGGISGIFHPRAYTAVAPEITLHTTTIITNPLADDENKPEVAGWDTVIKNTAGNEFATETITTKFKETRKETNNFNDLQWSNITVDVPEGLKDLPELKEQYILAKKQAHVANAFNLMGFLSGAARAVKGALNSLLPGEKPKNVSFLNKICRAQTKGSTGNTNSGESAYIGETEEGYSYVIAGGQRAKLEDGGDDGGNVYLKSFYQQFPYSGYQLSYDDFGEDFSKGEFVKVSAKLQINPGLKFSVSNPYGFGKINGKQTLSMLYTKDSTEGVIKQPVSRSLIIPVLMASRYPPSNPNCYRCAVPLTNPSNDYSTVSNSLPPITSYNTYNFGPITQSGRDKKYDMLTRGLNVSFNYDSVVELDCSFYIPDVLPNEAGELVKLDDGEKMYVFLALAQSYTLAWGNQPLQAENKELATINLYNELQPNDKYVSTDTRTPEITSLSVFVTVSCDNSEAGVITGKVYFNGADGGHEEPKVEKMTQKLTDATGFHLISSSFQTEVTAPVVSDVKPESE